MRNEPPTTPKEPVDIRRELRAVPGRAALGNPAAAEGTAKPRGMSFRGKPFDFRVIPGGLFSFTGWTLPVD
jgi:hypothetical protein